MGLVRLGLITVANNRMCVWIIRGGCKPNDVVKRVTLIQFADLFHDLPMAHKITVNQTGAFYFSQACCSENVFNFFQKQTNDSYRFISELMDVFLTAGVHQQPEQSNYLAEDQT